MKRESNMHIALVQDIATPDVRKNLEKAKEQILQAGREGADLVLLQELFQMPYFCQTMEAKNFQLAQPIPGPLTESLSEWAREAGVVLVAPFFEEAAPGLYFN